MHNLFIISLIIFSIHGSLIICVHVQVEFRMCKHAALRCSLDGCTVIPLYSVHTLLHLPADMAGSGLLD